MTTKRIFTLCCMLALVNAMVFAKDGAATDMGDSNYKQFNFKKAVLYYKKALKRDENNPYLLQKLADSYRLLNDWQAAEPYYARLADMDGTAPVNKLYYAEALRAAKKYSSARVYYLKSQAAFPQDSSIRERIKGMDQMEALEKDNGLYNIQNLKNINSEFTEFGVTMHGSDEIYFCSNRKPDAYVRRVDNWTNGTFLELYAANVKDTGATAGSVSLLPSDRVNKKFHEASPCYNEKRNELYFDRSNYNGTRSFPSSDKTVKLKIFKVGWLPDAKVWNGEVKEAVPFNNKEYSVSHATLNKNADTLYFASDMPGGYGRADIYMATRVQIGRASCRERV